MKHKGIGVRSVYQSQIRLMRTILCISLACFASGGTISVLAEDTVVGQDIIALKNEFGELSDRKQTLQTEADNLQMKLKKAIKEADELHVKLDSIQKNPAVRELPQEEYEAVCQQICGMPLEEFTAAVGNADASKDQIQADMDAHTTELSVVDNRLEVVNSQIAIWETEHEPSINDYQSKAVIYAAAKNNAETQKAYLDELYEKKTAAETDASEAGKLVDDANEAIPVLEETKRFVNDVYDKYCIWGEFYRKTPPPLPQIDPKYIINTTWYDDSMTEFPAPAYGYEEFTMHLYGSLYDWRDILAANEAKLQTAQSDLEEYSTMISENETKAAAQALNVAGLYEITACDWDAETRSVLTLCVKNVYALPEMPEPILSVSDPDDSHKPIEVTGSCNADGNWEYTLDWASPLEKQIPFQIAVWIDKNGNGVFSVDSETADQKKI